MGYIQFDSRANLAAATQEIVATPLFDDGTPPVIVWWDPAAVESVVIPAAGADGTWLMSSPWWDSDLAQDWWASRLATEPNGYAGLLAVGVGSTPVGWQPAASGEPG